MMNEYTAKALGESASAMVEAQNDRHIDLMGEIGELNADLAAAQERIAALEATLKFCKQTSDFVLNNPPEKTSPMRALWEISGQIGEALQAKEAE